MLPVLAQEAQEARTLGWGRQRRHVSGSVEETENRGEREKEGLGGGGRRGACFCLSTLAEELCHILIRSCSCRACH